MNANIYLAGEEHHQHRYRLAEIHLVKQLVAKNAITALSLELEFDRYQHILDSFSTSGPFKDLSDYAPLVYLAKKSCLDIIASDYRDNLVGHLINEVSRLDDASNAPDSEKEVDFLPHLRPLSYDDSGQIKSGDNIYSRFSSNLASAKDIYDFLSIVYYEERERFAVNLLSSYLKRKPGSRVLHICGLSHVASLKEKFVKARYSVEVVDLTTIQES